MADENLKDQENPNYSFKLTTDESRSKEGGHMTNRNESSGLNSKRGKKKKLIKVKGEEKNKSELASHTRKGETKVNNIVIHINNQINTLHTSQNIQVNTANNVDLIRSNKDVKIAQNRETPQLSPNGFVELKIDNNEVNFKYNNSVIEASQNKLFVNLSRLLFSPKCQIYYIICIIMTILISLIAVVDIFLKIDLMNMVWLFVIEMMMIAIIAVDITCRIYKTEYFSNILLIGLDIVITAFTPIQIIRFATKADTTIAHVLHILFVTSIVLRFFVVLVVLRRTIKRQEDVRQNVEEIINFSEIIEENHKNFDNDSNRNKKLKKITPAISFVDDEGVKNRKGLNLIKEEKKEKEMLEDDNAHI